MRSLPATDAGPGLVVDGSCRASAPLRRSLSGLMVPAVVGDILGACASARSRTEREEDGTTARRRHLGGFRSLDG